MMCTWGHSPIPSGPSQTGGGWIHFGDRSSKRVQPDEALVVTTRAAAKRKEKAELISEQKTDSIWSGTKSTRAKQSRYSSWR